VGGWAGGRAGSSGPPASSQRYDFRGWRFRLEQQHGAVAAVTLMEKESLLGCIGQCGAVRANLAESAKIVPAPRNLGSRTKSHPAPLPRGSGSGSCSGSSMHLRMGLTTLTIMHTLPSRSAAVQTAARPLLPLQSR